MIAAFADTFFYLALLRTDDPSHNHAISAARLNQPIVTSEFIILEIGNACARSEDHADFGHPRCKKERAAEKYEQFARAVAAERKRKASD